MGPGLFLLLFIYTAVLIVSFSSFHIWSVNDYGSIFNDEEFVSSFFVSSPLRRLYIIYSWWHNPIRDNTCLIICRSLIVMFIIALLALTAGRAGSTCIMRQSSFPMRNKKVKEKKERAKQRSRCCPSAWFITAAPCIKHQESLCVSEREKKEINAIIIKVSAL